MGKKNQSGVALLVALIGLIILTVVGVATMGELLVQSSTVRNEQFRQRVFYAASSELNAMVGVVNSNTSADDDPLIDQLLDSKDSSSSYRLDLGTTALTGTDTVDLKDISISAERNDFLGCSGESVGRVKVLSGQINVTAKLADARPNSGIRSHQRQRFVYCWP